MSSHVFPRKPNGTCCFRFLVFLKTFFSYLYSRIILYTVIFVPRGQVGIECYKTFQNKFVSKFALHNAQQRTKASNAEFLNMRIIVFRFFSAIWKILFSMRVWFFRLKLNGNVLRNVRSNMKICYTFQLKIVIFLGNSIVKQQFVYIIICTLFSYSKHF